MKKVILILCVALVLRLISLNQSLWLDEGTTALVSQMGIRQYLNNFAPGDFHPPLFYLLQMIWVKMFGVSEIALRSLSVMFGLLTIYVVYLIGRSLTGPHPVNKNIFSTNDEKATGPHPVKRDIGLYAAIFLASSGLHIYYSQEARMYAMATFFVSLAVYSFINIRRRKYWVIFGLSLAASILTHYLTILMFLVFATYVVLDKQREKYIHKYIYAHSFLAIGFLWLPVFITQLSKGIGVEERVPRWAAVLGQTSPKEISLVAAKFIYGRISVDNNLIYGILVLLGIILFGLIIVRHIVKSSKLRLPVGQERLIWMWLTLPFLVTAFIGIWIPVFSYFRLLFILPAFYLLIGAGVASFKGKTYKLLIAAILLINLSSSVVYLFNPKFHREDWRRAYSFINIKSGWDAQVIFPEKSQHEAYDYYNLVKYNENNRGLLYELFKSTEPMPTYQVMVLSENYPSDTIDELKDYNIVWLMRYAQPIFDPEDSVRLEIENKGYNKVSEHDFNGVVVWRYKLSHPERSEGSI